MAMLVGDRAGIVLHDGPRGVRAEFVAPGVVELLDCSDERHVAVADQIEEAVARRYSPFGDRHHEAKVGPHDPVLDLDDLPVEAVDLIHYPGIGVVNVEFRPQRCRLVLQVVELPEQPHLLFASQKRNLVEAREVGGQT